MDEQLYTWLNERLNRLENKIDDLSEWKWKLSGAVMVLAFITSAAVAWLR